MTLEERAQSRDPEELLAVASDPRLKRGPRPRPARPPRSARQCHRGHRQKPCGTQASQGHARHRQPSPRSTPRFAAPHPHLYTFELVKIALLPAVPADVKVGVDEIIISRLEQVSEGERLTLAKQASGRVAGALLLDTQERVCAAALENPRDDRGSRSCGRSLTRRPRTDWSCWSAVIRNGRCAAISGWRCCAMGTRLWRRRSPSSKDFPNPWFAKCSASRSSARRSVNISWRPRNKGAG